MVASPLSSQGLNPNAVEFTPFALIQAKMFMSLAEAALPTSGLKLNVPPGFLLAETGAPPPSLEMPPGLDVVPPGLDVRQDLQLPPGLESAGPVDDEEEEDQVDDHNNEEFDAAPAAATEVKGLELEPAKHDGETTRPTKRTWSQILFPDQVESRKDETELADLRAMEDAETASITTEKAEDEDLDEDVVEILEDEGSDLEDAASTRRPPPGLEAPAVPPGLEHVGSETELLMAQHALLVQQNSMLWEYHHRLANSESAPPGVWNASWCLAVDAEDKAESTSEVSTGHLSGSEDELSESSSASMGDRRE